MAVQRPAGDFDRSYQQDMSFIRKPWQWVLLFATIAVAFSIPMWGNNYLKVTANRMAYTIIAVQGLNILTGYTGQISLGQAAFMLVGGYVSALLSSHLNLHPFITIPLAGLGAGLFGLIFGLPSLRVKGFYLAMATLAAQFIIPWMSRQTFKEYLGGTNGQIGVIVPQLGSYVFDSGTKMLPVSLTMLLITSVIAFNVSRTRLGRAFVAVRDNDLAAELLGVNPFGYKLRSFFIAAVYAGLAGALKAHSQRAIGTELGYGLEESIFFLGMLVIGGLGTNLGPFLGAIFVIVIEDLGAVVGSALLAVLPAELAGNVSSAFKPIFFGLALMLFLIFEPRGLAHRWTLIKAAWRLRPFSY